VVSGRVFQASAQVLHFEVVGFKGLVQHCAKQPGVQCVTVLGEVPNVGFDLF